MDNIRYVELEFEDMLKHDSKVICSHFMLKDKKYSKPMLFNELLVEIGTDFGSGICKSIFSQAKWYIETLDSDDTLNTIIDMSKYKKTGDVKKSKYDATSLEKKRKEDQKNNDILATISESIFNMYDGLSIGDLMERINEVDKRTDMSKEYINSFQDIANTVTLKKPNDLPIRDEDLDKLLHDYINSGDNKIYYDENTPIGELIGFDSNKLSIKVTDIDKYNSMKNHFVSIVFLTTADKEDPDNIFICDILRVLVRDI